MDTVLCWGILAGWSYFYLMAWYFFGVDETTGKGPVSTLEEKLRRPLELLIRQGLRAMSFLFSKRNRKVLTPVRR